MISEITKFVTEHVVRGECQCGLCIDGGTEQPKGHTANLVFFKVALVGEPDAEKFKKLVQENRTGEFNNVDLFDGLEHSYMELGGWIGDQGMAMMFMGLGSLLGLWELMTPYNILPDIPDATAMQMAQAGLVTVRKVA